MSEKVIFRRLTGAKVRKTVIFEHDRQFSLLQAHNRGRNLKRAPRGAPFVQQDKQPKARYWATSVFTLFFLDVATIVFTPFTARTMASTNRSTASRACSTGASAMPLVMMAVTFW